MIRAATTPSVLLLFLLASGLPDAVAAVAESCRDDCIPASCVSEWWRKTNAIALSGAAVLVFFATFLPRVLVRLVIFVLTKLPFIRQYATSYSLSLCCTHNCALCATDDVVMCMLNVRRTAEDFRKSCMGSSAYLISASLVILALNISDLNPFFCHMPMYIWGAFFIVWLYSLFNVVESVRGAFMF